MTLHQKSGHRIKTPSSKLAFLVSSCWKKNFIRDNAHNFFILSLVFLKLLIVSVTFFLGHPVYTGALPITVGPESAEYCYRIMPRRGRRGTDNSPGLFQANYVPIKLCFNTLIHRAFNLSHLRIVMYTSHSLVRF